MKISRREAAGFLLFVFSFNPFINLPPLYALEISNTATVGFTFNGANHQVNTNAALTTVILPPAGAGIIAPKGGSNVPSSFTVFGTAPPSASIVIKVDGAPLAGFTSDPDGSYIQPVSLSPGPHILLVTANGVDGESVSVTVSAGIVPGYPYIENLPSHARISEARPVIQGTASPNSPIAIYAKSSPLRLVGVGTADAAGNFSIKLSQNLNHGVSQLFILDTTNNVTSAIIEILFIDPFGVVFDSASGAPIQGAVVTLYNAGTGFLSIPGVDIAGGDSNPQTTGAGGNYSFNAVNGSYYYTVSAAGYSFPSAQAVFPVEIAQGSKGEVFTVAGALLNINLPMDPSTDLLRVEMDANKKEVSVGEVVTYTVRVTNRAETDVNNFVLNNAIPPGFKFLPGRGQLDHVRVNPSIDGAVLFSVPSVPRGQESVLKYQVVVGSGVTFGSYESRVHAGYPAGPRISNIASETVRVVPDPLFDLGTVIGKVFDDRNGNGVQDEGEETLPFARIVTAEGSVITADRTGRWHLPGLMPGRHLFRIDEASLPPGSEFTTPNMVVVDLTRGLMSKVNFGVRVLEEERLETGERRQQRVAITQGTGVSRRLNVSHYPQIPAAQDFHGRFRFGLFTNYPGFVEKWRLDVRNQRDGSPIKSLEGGPLSPELLVAWDGLGDDGLPIQPGQDYDYILSVWDKEGRMDATEPRVLWLRQDPVHLWNEEGAVQEWVQVQRKVDWSGPQAIPLQGQRVTLRVEDGAPGAEVVIGDQQPFALNFEGGEGVELILPNGDHPITVVEKDASGDIPYRRTLKEGDPQLFLVAMGDFKGGYSLAHGHIETVQQEDRFQGGFWQEEKLSYYLKGKILGKYLITSSLDTTRRQKELFRQVDPKKYYPVYGDASTIDYAAGDTQGKLYCLVEWDNSKAVWGNYSTDLDRVDYAKFKRSLYGGKLDYRSVATTRYGEPKTRVTAFNAKAKSVASHDEFAGTGGSLYYLKHADVTEGSERVSIEVRDRINGQKLSVIEQASGADYQIDYSQGRILMWRPVSSIAESSAITSGEALSGNPVYLVVDYSYEPKDKYYQGVSGVHASQALSDAVQVGGTYVQEEKPNENYELRGADVTFRPNADTTVKAEYAESRSQSLGQSVSLDGGLSFDELQAGQGALGRAYGVKGATKLAPNARLSAYYALVDRDFSSADTQSLQGTEKFGAASAWDINDRTQVSLRLDSQQILDGGNLQSLNLIGAEEVTTLIAQFKRVQDRVTWIGEYRRQTVDSPVPGRLTETNQSGDAVAVKAIYQVNDKLSVFAEHQEPISGDMFRQETLGAEIKPVQPLSLKVAQTFGTGGAATIVGAELNTPDGRSQAFVNKTSPLAGQSSEALSYGVKSKVDEQKEVFVTQTDGRSPLEGRKRTLSFGASEKVNERVKITGSNDVATTSASSARTAVVGVSDQVSDSLQINAAFERGRVCYFRGLNADRNSGSIGLAYSEAALQASMKAELRTERGDEDKNQYLFQQSVQYSLNPDTTLFANSTLSKSRNRTLAATDAAFSEFTVGTAFRPLSWDWLQMIMKSTYFENRPAAGQSRTDGLLSEKGWVFSGEGIYDATSRLQLTEKLAVKWGSERVIDFDYAPTLTWLWINRFHFKITDVWGAAAEYRILAQREAADRNRGFLFELTRDFDFLDFALGYNFTGFSDDLVHQNDYSAYGPYFRATFKLDENKIGLGRAAAKPHNRRKSKKPKIMWTEPTAGSF